MKAMRFAELRPEEVLDLTSLTVEEFESLVPRFEQEFLFHMTEWTFEGKPRDNRRYSTYKNSPLPTPEDRLLFVLMYLKNNPVQSLHGHFFSLPLGKTNMWIHVLLPILSRTLQHMGVAPARSIEHLRERLEIKIDPPFSAKTEPRDRSHAPKIPRGNDSSIAERRSGIP